MLSGAGEEEEDDDAAGGAVVSFAGDDEDDLQSSVRQLPLLLLCSPPSSAHCSGRSAGRSACRVLEDGGDDSDHSRGGEGDPVGLLFPPTPCVPIMLEEATDSPTLLRYLLAADVDGGRDVLQLVPLLSVPQVGVEQLPLPELCLPAATLAVLCLDPAHPSILPSNAIGGGGGLAVGDVGAPHDDVEPIRGGIGCVAVAGPLHHLLPPLCAGLELLPACAAGHSLLFLFGLS